MAAVRTVLPSVVSVPLPATGGLVDVFTAHGQTYVRDIQKDLVPRNWPESLPTRDTDGTMQ